MGKKKLMWSFISILAVIGMAVGGWAMNASTSGKTENDTNCE